MRAAGYWQSETPTSFGMVLRTGCDFETVAHIPMTIQKAHESLRRLIAAAEDASAAWKARPETVGVDDQGVAALMAVQTSLPAAREGLGVLEKRKSK